MNAKQEIKRIIKSEMTAKLHAVNVKYNYFPNFFTGLAETEMPVEKTEYADDWAKARAEIKAHYTELINAI